MIRLDTSEHHRSPALCADRPNNRVGPLRVRLKAHDTHPTIPARSPEKRFKAPAKIGRCASVHMAMSRKRTPFYRPGRRTGSPWRTRPVCGVHPERRPPSHSTRLSKRCEALRMTRRPRPGGLPMRIRAAGGVAKLRRRYVAALAGELAPAWHDVASGSSGLFGVRLPRRYRDKTRVDSRAESRLLRPPCPRWQRPGECAGALTFKVVTMDASAGAKSAAACGII
jgi:hypothetical protein